MRRDPPRPDVRPPRFRRNPFMRDVASDPGRASAPRITALHISPSTFPSSRPLRRSPFVAQSHTPHDRCVRFAPAVADGHATLASRPALPLTCTGLPPAGSRQLPWRTDEGRPPKIRPRLRRVEQRAGERKILSALQAMGSKVPAQESIDLENSPLFDA